MARAVCLLLLACVLAGCGDGRAPPGADPADAGQSLGAADPGLSDAGYLDDLAALGYVDYAHAGAGDARDGVIIPRAGDSEAAAGEGPPSAGPGERVGAALLEVAPGVNLIVSLPSCEAMLMDNDGRVLHRWSDRKASLWNRVQLMPDGSLVLIGQPAKGKSSYVARLGWEGRQQWRAKLPAHHDLELTPDGSLLALTKVNRRLPERFPGRVVRDNALARLSTDGQPLGTLSLYDALSRSPEVFSFQPPEELPGGSKGVIDVVHANSVEWIERPDLVARSPIFGPGHVLVSLRHQNAIVIVDWAAGKAVWAWGQGVLQLQHEATLMASGHILVFDNGTEQRGFSRVLEVDPLSREVVWEYRAPDPASFFEATRGQVQELLNGNLLVVRSNSGEAFELTRDGRVVWRFFNPIRDEQQARAAIRMHRYSHAFVDPILAAHGG